MPATRLALTRKLTPGALRKPLRRLAGRVGAKGALRVIADHGALTDAPRVALVYNPQSGHFSPPVLAALAQGFEAAGRQVICYDSLSFRADDDGPFDIICMLGGDGTARLVISANWPLGPGEAQSGAGHARFCTYPAGTINLVAREARYPQAVAAFVRRCLAANAPRRHFVGRLGDELFQCCASVGPDAAAVARVSSGLKRRIGRLAYGVAVAGMLRRWPRHRLDVTADGAQFAAEAVFVCKGRYYAGAWMLDDGAALEEDSFRLLALPRARRRDLARLALAVVVHPAFGDKRWLRLSAQRVTVDRADDAAGLPVQADGDIVGLTPVEMAINPVPVPFL